MSVVLTKKSGEGEEDIVNLMASGEGSKYGWRSQISGIICGSLWWIGAAVVLLLLILILGVVAHNSTTINERHSKSESLIKSLMVDRDPQKDAQYQVKINSSNLAKEVEELQRQNKGLQNQYTGLQSQNSALQSQYTGLQSQYTGLQSQYTGLQSQYTGLQSQNSGLQSQNSGLQSQYTGLQSQYTELQSQNKVLQSQNDMLQSQNNELHNQYKVLQDQYNATAESRDKLQEEIDTLKVNTTVKTCLEGWLPFGGNCYYFSANGMTSSWESSRKDCKARGGDLAIVNSKEELVFVSRVYSVTWIGLSDKEQENKWKWVDGSDLVGDDYWQDGEPNNSDGNEDCAEVSRSAKRFNDVPCNRKFSWVCEI